MPTFEMKLVTTITTNVNLEAESYDEAVATLRKVATEKFSYSLPHLQNTVRHAIYVKGEGIPPKEPRERRPRKNRRKTGLE